MERDGIVTAASVTRLGLACLDICEGLSLFLPIGTFDALQLYHPKSGAKARFAMEVKNNSKYLKESTKMQRSIIGVLNSSCVGGWLSQKVKLLMTVIKRKGPLVTVILLTFIKKLALTKNYNNVDAESLTRFVRGGRSTNSKNRYS